MSSVRVLDKAHRAQTSELIRAPLYRSALIHPYNPTTTPTPTTHWASRGAKVTVQHDPGQLQPCLNTSEHKAALALIHQISIRNRTEKDRGHRTTVSSVGMETDTLSERGRTVSLSCQGSSGFSLHPHNYMICFHLSEARTDRV